MIFLSCFIFVLFGFGVFFFFSAGVRNIVPPVCKESTPLLNHTHPWGTYWCPRFLLGIITQFIIRTGPLRSTFLPLPCSLCWARDYVCTASQCVKYYSSKSKLGDRVHLLHLFKKSISYFLLGWKLYHLVYLPKQDLCQETGNIRSFPFQFQAGPEGEEKPRNREGESWKPLLCLCFWGTGI